MEGVRACQERESGGNIPTWRVPHRSWAGTGTAASGTGIEGSTRVSAADHDAVRVEYWRIFDDIDHPPGQSAVDEARRRVDSFASRWRTRYPRTVDALLGELAYLTAHLRFPKQHWRRIRHTNLIERTQRVSPADGSRSSAGCPASGPASRSRTCHTRRRKARA